MQTEKVANEILSSRITSRWLKESLRSALSRDPLDAAADAQLLAEILTKRCEAILATARKVGK